MIMELKSTPDIWRRMPSEMRARRFLKGLIWQNGRYLSALRVGGFIRSSRPELPSGSVSMSRLPTAVRGDHLHADACD